MNPMLCIRHVRKKHHLCKTTLIGSPRNIWELLDCFHVTPYIPVLKNIPRFTIIQFNTLVWFKIQIYFWSSLSVRVSDSGQTIHCTIKYCTKVTCHNLHSYHDKTLYPNTIQHTKAFLFQTITCSRKYCMGQTCHSLHNYTHSQFIPGTSFC